MLKVLIKKQITETLIHTFHKGNTHRSGRSGRSGKATMIMMVIAMVYLAVVFTGMSVFLCKQLMPIEMGWLFYLISGGAGIIFGTFGSVFSTCFTLYMAKDNDLLLSMPISVRDVVLSRLFSVYVMGLLYSGLIVVPGVVVGWVVGGFSLAKVIGGLVLILLISLIVLGLSCLLGWCVAKISLRLKNRSFLTVLVALVFLGLYYLIYFRFMSKVQDILETMIQVGGSIRRSAYPVYIFGMIGEGHWLGMLCWTAGVLVLLGLIWLILKKTFLSISTATPTPKRAVYHEKGNRRCSVSSALFRKEWNRFSTSANYMLNCGMPLLLQLGFGGYMLFKGGKLVTVAAALFRSMPGAVPVFLCTACCMLGGMVDVSAPSVSLEGSSVWQVQCLPVTPWQVLRAKLLLHLSLAAVPTLFCTVIMMILAPATILQKLLLLVVSVLNTVLFALFDLFLGLKMPNLNWTNEIVPIKQSAPVLIAIFSGIGLSMAFGGLFLWFGWRMGATAWMLLFSLLFLAADAALFFWLKGPGSRRFAAL